MQVRYLDRLVPFVDISSASTIYLPPYPPTYLGCLLSFLPPTSFGDLHPSFSSLSTPQQPSQEQYRPTSTSTNAGAVARLVSQTSVHSFTRLAHKSLGVYQTPASGRNLGSKQIACSSESAPGFLRNYGGLINARTRNRVSPLALATRRLP